MRRITSAVVREMYARLGPYALSTVEGVRNYHRPDTFPARADVVQLGALADIYGVKLEDIAPQAAEESPASRRARSSDWAISSWCVSMPNSLPKMLGNVYGERISPARLTDY